MGGYPCREFAVLPASVYSGWFEQISWLSSVGKALALLQHYFLVQSSESPPFIQLLTVLLPLPDMTLLSSQSSSLAAPSGSVSTETPEQRMLEKRAKVVAELLQTEKDYIRDLEMCIEKVMVPLQQAQVGDRGSLTNHQRGPLHLKC